ncbi:MAG TPA: cation acetate symporter [Candidatus Dormibacteraeota bacterium]|nr:cation acetate symporter [Candidatus Dormibacteraeota bacterium]
MTNLAAVAGLLAMLIATVSVGVFARRFARTTSDLLVAARAVPPPANAAAISGEYLSAASFLGIAGLVMKFGYDVLWYPVGYAAGYLVLLVFIAGPLRRFGAYTIPDFAEGRFDSPGFRRLAVGLVIVIGLFYALPQMKAAGITMSSAAGVPYTVGVGLMGAVVVTIVVAGGMRGVTLVQAMQFMVKFFAITVPVLVLLFHFGAPSGIFSAVTARQSANLPQATVLHVAQGEEWRITQAVDISLDHPTEVRLAPPVTGAQPVYVGAPQPKPPLYQDQVVTLASSAVLPAGLVRWEQSADVRLPAGAPVPFGAATPQSPTASWLRPFGPLAGGSGQPLLFTYSLIVGIVCGTMGLPHILVRFYTNPDARAARRTAWLVLVLVGLFYLWPPLWGVIGRLQAPELYVGDLTDSVVLLLPRRISPPVVGETLAAITTAGAFAAFAATLSGLLISLAGALGHDVYGRWLRPGATGLQRNRAFRGGAVIAGVAAALLGLLVENFDISVLVGWAFAIAASSFFPLLVLGIWWRGLTTAGAALGTAVGGVAATLAIVTTMLAAASPSLSELLTHNSALAVILAQPAILTLPIAFAVMVGVSLLRPRVPAGVAVKMVQLHIPDRLGLRRDYIRD